MVRTVFSLLLLFFINISFSCNTLEASSSNNLVKFKDIKEKKERDLQSSFIPIDKMEKIVSTKTEENEKSLLISQANKSYDEKEDEEMELSEKNDSEKQGVNGQASNVLINTEVNKENAEVLQRSDENIDKLDENQLDEKEIIKSDIEEKSFIKEEKILDDDRLFPFKEETKKIETKKLPSILSSIEILKELEDANLTFNYSSMMIRETKDLSKKKEEIAQKEVTKNSNTNVEEKTKENKDANTPFKMPPNNVIENNSNIEEKDGDLFTSSNEEEPVFIDDNETLSGFDESYVNNMSEVLPPDVDDENFLTFDEEEKLGKIDEPSFKEKPKTKYEEVEGKGQLSSIVDEDDKVNISRYTNILKGQNIDFSYPGEGWVYLGEESSKKGLSYSKRKMKDGKTFFTFIAEEEGNYVLNFSYFDGFSGDFIVDAISVKVLPNPTGVQQDSVVFEYKGKTKDKNLEEPLKKEPDEVSMDAEKVGIKVDETPKKTENEMPETNKVEVVSKKEELNKGDISKSMSSNKKKEDKSLAISKNEGISFNRNSSNKDDVSSYKEPEVFANVANISPENAKGQGNEEIARKIINEVSESISNGDAKTALEKIENFFAVASTNIDEAYFLRGKAYELNSELKNIKKALASYKFLIRTFPTSSYWNEADARIRYIEKFFVNIK